jgi:class 3 adenylate cyclase
MHCGRCDHENRDGARFCESCGAALAADAPDAGASTTPDAVGEGRYRVIKLLGEGSRKVVYAGHDSRLGRDVAVALIKTEGLDEVGRHRIEREARAMARLGDHPNIVTVFDVGEDDGRPYIVSELMPGGSVADVLAHAEEHRLPIDETLQIAAQVALALAHAHDRGVVHRDLKPANVWLAADRTARLGDFGLAVEVDRSRITSEGMVIGTVAYLAPEQAVGRAPDARSDLYALGAFLYETLTGRPPFLGDDAVSVISQHLNTAPVAPSWHNAAVTAPVEALVLALLEKDPSARPPDAKAVATALEGLRASDAVASAEPAAAATTPPVRAAAFGRFIGRADELETLKAMFDESQSGRSRVAMVVGEPGIGKTRLVEELGVYAAVRGAQACWGHCYEGDLGAPYLPFVEALRTYVRDVSDEELRSQLSTGAPEVATLVSELRTRFPDMPPSPALDGDAERLRLFEGVSAFLANASAIRPIVLVLDDVHWADKPTLLLLQYLARNLRRERILLVCTYRDVELDRTHPLADMIAALRREHLYERVLLRGLDRDEVKSFIDAVGERETVPAFAELIYRETEGNPFFVGEILKHLAESGALKRVDGEWVGTAEGVAAELPEGVREVIGRRLSSLGDDCNRMLTIGAAMPGGFSLDVIRLVMGADEDTVLDLLDEALERQILRERREQSGVYEFTHALIRQTLYSELNTPRRVRLHRQILAGLEELYDANPDAHLTDLAYHAFQAAPGGDIDKAVDYATRAGRPAEAAAAYEEAARSYDLALQALDLDDAPDVRVRASLLLALGSAHQRSGQRDGARAALLAAAELGRGLDDATVIANAACIYSSERFTSSGTDPDVTALLEEAVGMRQHVDDALRATLLSYLGAHIAFVDNARHRSLAEEAMEAARASGDASALAIARQAFAFVDRDRTPDQMVADFEEIAALAMQSGDVYLYGSALNGKVIGALYGGNRPLLDEAIAALVRLADESRSPFARFMAAGARTATAILSGEYGESERLIAELGAVARRTGDRVNINNVGVTWFPLLREQGRAADLEVATRRAVDEQPRLPAWRTGLAQALADQGKLDEAAEQVEWIAHAGFSSVADDVLFAYTLAGVSEVVALLGDADLARVLARRLAPFSGAAVILAAAAFHGAVDRILGLLDTTMGAHDDAIAHHEAAIRFHERLGANPWLARSRYDLAGALLARDAPGDRERALGLLNDALDAANTIGQTKLVQEVLTAKLGLQGIASGSSMLRSIDAVAAGVSLDRPDLRRHAASDGTVTVLFSDIESYTQLNERLGDLRTQQLLRAHDAIVRAACASADGTVVKSQGDGYMLVFSQPAAALACALDVQRANAKCDYGSDAPAVRVRIGLHAGEVIREGDDFFGRTVILAARIAGQADGGEILVSDQLRDALSSSEANYAGTRDVALKGFDGTHRLHAIAW